MYTKNIESMAVIPLATFEKLVRESEQLAIIKEMAKTENCLFAKDLKPILDIKEGGEE